MANALWMTVVALALPITCAYFVAVARSLIFERLAFGITRTLDVIPIFMWIAIAYVAFGSSGMLLKLAAITLVALPYVIGLCLPRFLQIANSTFSMNARAIQAPAYVRIFQHFVPNAASVLAYPFAVIFGLTVTFDAALGLLGMDPRSELSLGILLLRAKERAPIDPFLDICAIGALGISLTIFWCLRGLLDVSRRNPTLVGHN